MEQRLQNVLVPGKDSTIVEIELNKSWQREYNTVKTVFGIEFEAATVLLEFEAYSGMDGAIKGRFYATFMDFTETSPDRKILVEVDEFKDIYKFDIGKDDDEIYVIYKGQPVAFRQSFKVDAKEAIRYISPDFGFRPSWDVKIVLL